jgi:hypothetical protein
MVASANTGGKLLQFLDQGIAGQPSVIPARRRIKSRRFFGRADYLDLRPVVIMMMSLQRRNYFAGRQLNIYGGAQLEFPQQDSVAEHPQGKRTAS